MRYTTRPIAVEFGDVMEASEWPLDPQAAATLVLQVIDDIDASDDERRACLLADLLCAAWPSQLAQNS